MKEYKIDWNEVEYLSHKLVEKEITPEAISQRIIRALKADNVDLYLTLKMVQAKAFYENKKIYV